MHSNAKTAEQRTERPAAHRKSGSTTRTRNKRVAFNVTEALDKNVEICALQKGVLKNDIFVEALKMFLKSQRMEPDREPIISLSYR